MAVNPYDPSQPTGTSQVELSAELRALKGVNVNHRDKIQVLEDLTTPLDGITDYGKELLLLPDEAANLDRLGGGAGGIEVFQQPTLAAIVDLLGLSDPSMTIENSAGKTCVTFLSGLMIQIVNLDVPSGGTNFTWLRTFPNTVFGAISGLNSDASNASSVRDITTSGGRADHGNVSNHDCSVWAIGR